MNTLTRWDPLNTLTRWDPFRELDELHNRLGTLFGRAPARKDGTKEETMTIAEWAPLVDIIEELSFNDLQNLAEVDFGGWAGVV